MENIISYANLLESRKKFRDHDIYDDPGLFYFKILFYFDNKPDDSSDGFTSNLLGLDYKSGGVNTDTGSVKNSNINSSWDVNESTHTKNTNNMGMQYGSQSAATSVNTAYNYLILNGEQERAEYLKDFIFLLSDISSECPWYFKSIEGLESALTREYYKDFKFEENKSFNIKCMQDPIDTRITTLLELYRASCFSHVWKKEIVPANLRKFDMGIYIFQAPIKGINYQNENRKINANVKRSEISSDSEFTNCKYFEFHNCEINQNSISSCFSEMSNEKGFILEPTITIDYDDCYISSYNEDLCRSIGDLVKIDIEEFKSYSNIAKDNTFKLASVSSDIDKLSIKDEYAKAHEDLKGDYSSSSVDVPNQPTSYKDIYVNQNYPYNNKGIVNTLIEGTVGKAVTKVENVVKGAYLGNVYGLSVRNIVGSAEQIASGDIIGGIASVVKNTEKTVNSIAKGTVVSDLLPSLVNKQGKITAQNIYKNL